MRVLLDSGCSETPGMTLAVIFFLGISTAISALNPAIAGAQSTSAPESQQQPTTQPATPPQASTPATPQSKPPAAAKPRRKKRIASSNCGTLPAPSTPAQSGTSASGDAAQTSGVQTSSAQTSSSQNSSAQNSAAPAAAKPCPPKKVIVRHGGTSEPSIQLAGGPANDKSAQQRNAANQLLGIAESNLKKIAEAQLTPAQQDTVSQIRQFMDQSKAAADSGDTERARTLAWKAETLSEDLVNPQK